MKFLNYNYSIDREKITLFYKNFGFVIIKNFFDIKTIKKIRSQIFKLSKKKLKTNIFIMKKLIKN